MNRAQTAEAAKVMAAWAEGATIQCRAIGRGERWGPASTPLWTWNSFEYRIKPAPRTVPWTAETFPKDRPVWVRRKTMPADRCSMITAVCSVDVEWRSLRDGTITDKEHLYMELLRDYIQHDGSPCGATEEG